MQSPKRNHRISLTLADGSLWAIASDDSCGADINRALEKAMQLNPAPIGGQRMLILKNGLSPQSAFNDIFSENDLQSLARNGRITCQLLPAVNNDILAIQLNKLSQIFCSQSEVRGGVLVHGGLAEKDGRGVILAGPSDVGKTTASGRLPLPWKSHSDDCTLVVRDKNGVYRAHPWPTWSSFMFGGSGGSWNVQYNVPLAAIFHLEQSENDCVEPLGQGKAACLLNNSAEQAWQGFAADMGSNMRQTLNLQRFDNICELIKTVPSFKLLLCNEGQFWEKMEQVLRER